MTLQFMHDIESLRHVCEDVKRHCDYAGKETKPTVKFRGTVKLHGTSGAVNIKGETVTAMGRNRALTIQSDNFGFAHFVAGREDHFHLIAATINGSAQNNLTFYGEWCGTGIQKAVAVSSLPKMFVIFAIFNHSTDEWEDIHAYQFNDSVLELLNKQNIYLITQAPVFEIEIDFNNPTPAAELISQYTLQVEDRCPFSAMLGVEGVGEGLVWVSYDYPVRIYFKSKGEKHKKGGARTQVAVDPEKVADISALVDIILPEWRLEQGFQFLRENGIAVANTSTGEYLKWVAKDVLKEEEDRIAKNPYPWKDIQGTIMVRAKDYFFAHLNEMAGLPSAQEASDQ